MSKLDEAFGSGKISNIEDVFAKTKVVAENINKKSAKCIELSRKKVEYLDAKTKLSKSTEKFGNLQFELLLGNEIDEAEMDTLVAEITAYRERLNALDKELEEAKSALDTDNLKKEAEELKNEVVYASKETIEILRQRAQEARIAVQAVVDKINGDEVKAEVVVEAEPQAEPEEQTQE